jgi:hypothetical protein
MLFVRKNGWTRIAFTLLTIGILVLGFSPSAAGSDFNKEKVTPFVTKDEIKKMQETLRNKGHYRGQVDGVFGLQTRASIRAYQKAENLPITGQVDARTADGLGVRPELTWGNSENTGEGWHSADSPGARLRVINLRRALRAPNVEQARLRGGKSQGLQRPKITAETKLANRTECENAGLSAGNSKSQLHKARWKMRALFFPDHESVGRKAKKPKLKAGKEMAFSG